MGSFSIIRLKNSTQLLELEAGQAIKKTDLFSIIQTSKQPGSSCWHGENWVIGNTPQQGINWIGNPTRLLAGLIKFIPGSYRDDLWLDETRTKFQYSFKAQKGKISYNETANQVLLSQPMESFPILLFFDELIQEEKVWHFQGFFKVAGVGRESVDLVRGENFRLGLVGKKRTRKVIGLDFAAHHLAEQSKFANRFLVSAGSSCQQCGMKTGHYEEEHALEAHMTKRIVEFRDGSELEMNDFIGLCGKCHQRVHKEMLEADDAVLSSADL